MDEKEIAAQKAYEAYCEYASLVSNKKKWPPWSTLPIQIQQAWQNAAMAAIEACKN